MMVKLFKICLKILRASERRRVSSEYQLSRKFNSFTNRFNYSSFNMTSYCRLRKSNRIVKAVGLFIVVQLNLSDKQPVVTQSQRGISQSYHDCLYLLLSFFVPSINFQVITQLTLKFLTDSQFRLPYLFFFSVFLLHDIRLNLLFLCDSVLQVFKSLDHVSVTFMLIGSLMRTSSR